MVSDQWSRKGPENGVGRRSGDCRINFPTIDISVTRKYFFREFYASRKLHITYSFAIQRITWKKCLGMNFLENLISVT